MGWRTWGLIAAGTLILLVAWMSWNVRSNLEEQERQTERWQRGQYTKEELKEFDEILAKKNLKDR